MQLAEFIVCTSLSCLAIIGMAALIEKTDKLSDRLKGKPKKERLDQATMLRIQMERRRAG
jgi:hypothetical protein